MAEIKCGRGDCWYCKEGRCGCPEPEFVGDECESCVDRCDPAVNPEYRCEYWAACDTARYPKHGVSYRSKRQGKRILLNGYVFYTQNDDENGMGLTEERTGLYAGTMEQVRARWDVFVRGIAEFGDVMALPVGERLGRGRYIIGGVVVDETGTAEG